MGKQERLAKKRKKNMYYERPRALKIAAAVLAIPCLILLFMPWFNLSFLSGISIVAPSLADFDLAAEHNAFMTAYASILAFTTPGIYSTLADLYLYYNFILISSAEAILVVLLAIGFIIIIVNGAANKNYFPSTSITFGVTFAAALLVLFMSGVINILAYQSLFHSVAGEADLQAAAAWNGFSANSNVTILMGLSFVSALGLAIADKICAWKFVKELMAKEAEERRLNPQPELEKTLEETTPERKPFSPHTFLTSVGFFFGGLGVIFALIICLDNVVASFGVTSFSDYFLTVPLVLLFHAGYVFSKPELAQTIANWCFYIPFIGLAFSVIGLVLSKVKSASLNSPIKTVVLCVIAVVLMFAASYLYGAPIL